MNGQRNTDKQTGEDGYPHLAVRRGTLEAALTEIHGELQWAGDSRDKWVKIAIVSVGLAGVGLFAVAQEFEASLGELLSFVLFALAVAVGAAFFSLLGFWPDASSKEERVPFWHQIEWRPVEQAQSSRNQFGDVVRYRLQVMLGPDEGSRRLRFHRDDLVVTNSNGDVGVFRRNKVTLELVTLNWLGHRGIDREGAVTMALEAAATVGAEKLGELLGDVLLPSDIRGRALEHLVADEPSFGTRTIKALVTSALHELPVDVQTRAIAYLGEKGAQSACADLRELLSHDQAMTRAAAAAALARLEDKQSEPLLLELLGDAEWSVVTAAAEALGKVGSIDALPALRKLPDQRHDPPPRVVSALSEACDAIGARFGDDLAGQLSLDEADETGALTVIDSAEGHLAVASEDPESS